MLFFFSGLDDKSLFSFIFKYLLIEYCELYCKKAHQKRAGKLLSSINPKRNISLKRPTSRTHTSEAATRAVDVSGPFKHSCTFRKQRL